MFINDHRVFLVCGSFTDVSARCFLEVQLNLVYRRHWDKSVILLESTTSSKAAESEVIRWVARFPFPLARREYIYTRRWWLTTTAAEDVSNQAFALIISRTDNSHSTATNSAPPNGSSGDEARPSGLVSVRSYASNMLIRSHNGIDEVKAQRYFRILLKLRLRK